MSSLRKKLFGLILVAMLVGTIVFLGSVFGGVLYSCSDPERPGLHV